MKVYQNGNELNASIVSGVNKLADNVASTLGPKGRNVILKGKDGNPVITKDGVTVAKFVEFEDPFENLGAQVIKQASHVTNQEAGDGTTTATVLARSIVASAQRYLQTDASPVEMKRAMDKITLEVVSRLKNISRKIQSEEDIIHIATISANNDKQIGRLVAEAVSAAGKNGAITIEESKSNETSLDLIEGFQLPGGYIAGAFVTDKNRATMRYEKPYLLVCDSTVEDVEDLLPVLEQVARDSKPLVIVANNVEGQALAALIMNTVRGSMKVAAIKVNQYGEQRTSTLKDLAIATGATLVSPETGLELKEVKLEHLGMCKSIDSTKTHTTVVGGSGDRAKIEEQIQFLSAQLGQEEEQYEAERIQDRITRLASGVAVIKVGGNTEVEMIEKKHRIEDALAAIRSARDEGIVPGGGTALVKATAELTVEDFEFETWSEQCGWLILKEAFEAPVRQMAANAGMSPDTTIQKIKQLDQEDNLGVNFLTGEVVNMYDEGIIDPCKVTKNALQNAVSAAGTLMTTGYAIVELEH